jgi:hypothetical protein
MRLYGVVLALVVTSIWIGACGKRGSTPGADTSAMSEIPDRETMRDSVASVGKDTTP